MRNPYYLGLITMGLSVLSEYIVSSKALGAPPAVQERIPWRSSIYPVSLACKIKSLQDHFRLAHIGFFFARGCQRCQTWPPRCLPLTLLGAPSVAAAAGARQPLSSPAAAAAAAAGGPRPSRCGRRSTRQQRSPSPSRCSAPALAPPRPASCPTLSAEERKSICPPAGSGVCGGGGRRGAVPCPHAPCRAVTVCSLASQFWARKTACDPHMVRPAPTAGSIYGAQCARAQRRPQRREHSWWRGGDRRGEAAARCALHAAARAFSLPASQAMAERMPAWKCAQTMRSSARLRPRVLCAPARPPARPPGAGAGAAEPGGGCRGVWRRAGRLSLPFGLLRAADQGHGWVGRQGRAAQGGLPDSSGRARASRPADRLHVHLPCGQQAPSGGR